MRQLDEGKISTEQFAENAKDSVNTMLGFDPEDGLDAKQIANNAETIKAALNGDREAYLNLKFLAEDPIQIAINTINNTSGLSGIDEQLENFVSK